MVAEVAAGLAVSAAGAAVTAMATDAWSATRDRIVALWRRFRPEEAEDIAQGLDQSQRRLTEEPNPIDPDPDRAERIRDGLARALAALLEHHPEAAREMRALATMTEGEPGRPEQTKVDIRVRGQHNVTIGRNSGLVVNNYGRGPDSRRHG